MDLSAPVRAPLPTPAEASAAPSDPAEARARLATLLQEMRTLERRSAGWLCAVHPGHADSARNLLHYLALRRRDLRPLQELLAEHGLSSLGRAEAHAASAVRATHDLLARLAGAAPAEPHAGEVSRAAGLALLQRNAERLLGAAPSTRRVQVMVTLPSEAACDPALVRELVAGGMDCARINCAHDDEAAWSAMLQHLREAQVASGRRCRVLMDLAGPKVRTGPLAPGPRVVRVRPQRDALGRVTQPGLAWLAPAGAPAPAGAVHLPVPASFAAALRPGDRVALVDTRERRRELHVARREAHGVLAEVQRTAYVATGTRLRRHGAGDAPREAEVGLLPQVEAPLRLFRGDRLVLAADGRAAEPALRDAAGRCLRPARIACTLPAVLADVRPGESLWLDDGRIGASVVEASPEAVEALVTHARPGGDVLRGDKGLNLPDSALRTPPLTDDDLAVLPFVARHADMVGYSFVSEAGHVHELQRRLAAHGGEGVGLVLKIETRRAFANLPALLLAALRSPSAGVMIARGDLAVECGFERLAEVQEEILWLSEAAHLPVIWATQVLETLARTGQPSRAEITDAAMAERADCVMLNKGPYVVEAVRVLSGILGRMQGHQDRKRSLLRPLGVACGFLDDGGLSAPAGADGAAARPPGDPRATRAADSGA